MGRTFGRILTEAMATAGISNKELASRFHVDRSTVSRWRHDRNLPDRALVEQIDTALGIGGHLVRAWQVQTTGSVLADWRKSEPELDRAARAIEMLSPNYVPGLLQCRAYVEHVLRECVYPGGDDAIRREVARKSRRYPTLRATSDPLVVAVFPVVGLLGVPVPVRVAQVNHLVKAIDCGRLIVHLLPENTMATTVAPLTIYHLTDGGTAAIGDGVSGMLDYSTPGKLPLMVERMKRALGWALPPDQSRTLMEGMIH
ncbi:Scr1 family TA system antitoxin-like transcriptional regulator [Nocardiopsis sp. FIRDI 009]|uniref:helix-turn-helix domain-containing protein n=1 Tax=Nocardiopsis sp. FIRDI 009 TaxID=714197 RepID=UPI00130033B5|nr:Scr1 family TA system antitoxin-like transcriptional regulator [Nocardiopsis sp. FIRDI 009]